MCFMPTLHRFPSSYYKFTPRSSSLETLESFILISAVHLYQHPPGLWHSGICLAYARWQPPGICQAYATLYASIFPSPRPPHTHSLTNFPSGHSWHMPGIWIDYMPVVAYARLAYIRTWHMPSIYLSTWHMPGTVVHLRLGRLTNFNRPTVELSMASSGICQAYATPWNMPGWHMPGCHL